MDKDQRERLLDYNEELCRRYNETEDADLLEVIALTECLLLNDPDRVPEITELEVA